MPTVIDQLQSELCNELSFYHKGVRNITRPGQPHRVGDKIGFQAFAKNISSSLTMKTIAGWIRQAPATTFTSVSFSVTTLTPGQEKSLGAEIQAVVVADTNDMMYRDKIALIDATGVVDLSTVTFQDSGFFLDAIGPA